MHTKYTRQPLGNTHKEGYGTRFFQALQRASNTRWGQYPTMMMTSLWGLSRKHGIPLFVALKNLFLWGISRLRAFYLLTTVSFIKRKVIKRLILALGTRKELLHNEGEPLLATASGTLVGVTGPSPTSADPWAQELQPLATTTISTENLAETLLSEAVATAVSTAPKESFATSFYLGILSFFSLYNMTQATPPESTISFKHLQEIPATQLIENAMQNRGGANFDHQLYTTAVGCGLLATIVLGGSLLAFCGPVLLASIVANQGAQLVATQVLTTAVPCLDPTGSWTGYLLVKSVGIAYGMAASRCLKHHLQKEETSCETASEKLTTQDETLS